MEDREVKRMKSGCKRLIELPEEICAEIVSRLPFRSIMRFKTVCRRWREVTETMYFRRKFMIAHRNSSSSWSIMHGKLGWPYGEVVGFYGCESYGIPRSLDSYIPPHETVLDNNLIIACVDGLVLLQTNKEATTYSVGNPLLNQWVQLPPHPPSQGFNSRVKATGLVTRVEDGVVVEYKVVFMNQDLDLHRVKALRFEIYSSETRKWIHKRVQCPSVIVSLSYKTCLSLNKKLYWLDEDREAFVVYDFFDVDELQKCRVIPFPDDKTCFGKTYSTSGGFLFYISKLNYQLRLWRLEEYYTSDSRRWKLIQDINLTCFGLGHHYFPLAMHPFETNIVYMGTCKKPLVSIDLKTLKLTHHTKSSTYGDKMLSHYKGYANSSLYEGRHYNVFYAPQFILPQWMESTTLLPLV